MQLGEQSRELYLFDTFDGMTAPNEKDIAFTGIVAAEMLENSRKDDPYSVWCYSALEEVQQTMGSVGYNRANIHFIKGKVEDTLPDNAPEQIALLRLDTDWYESTYHELVHLFPRLAPGGVIIVDDYGHWQGARQAVDAYLRQYEIRLLLNRIDYTGRIGVVGG
jgi:O-methyltransferase